MTSNNAANGFGIVKKNYDNVEKSLILQLTAIIIIKKVPLFFFFYKKNRIDAQIFFKKEENICFSLTGPTH